MTARRYLSLPCPPPPDGCGVGAGRHCHTQTGRRAQETHAARRRLVDAPPMPTAEERVEAEKQRAIYRVESQARVRLTWVLSCGHIGGTSEPIPAKDAFTWPGGIVVCEVDDDYAVVVECRVRLVADPETVRQLAHAHGADEDLADSIAIDHADGAHPS